MTTLTYKGYLGSAELDLETKLCRGKLLHINDLVVYHSSTAADLEPAFRAAVDDYLSTCAEIGKTPESPFSGQFNVRVGPEVHRLAATQARQAGESMSEYVRKAILERAAPTRSWMTNTLVGDAQPLTAVETKVVTLRFDYDRGGDPNANTRQKRFSEILLPASRLVRAVTLEHGDVEAMDRKMQTAH